MAASPDDSRILQLLGMLLHQTGRNEESLRLLGRALKLRPDSAHYHCNLAGVPGPMTGATAYNVYVSTTSGAEVLQNASPIGVSTNWTEPATGLVGVGLPTPKDVGESNLTEIDQHVDTTAADDRVTLNLLSPGASKPAAHGRARRGSKPAGVLMPRIPHLLGPMQLLTGPATFIV